MKSLDQYWYSQNLLAWLLLPLSWLFRLASLIRRWMYRVKLLPSKSMPVPVIVIGNIAVGGTGKTPLLIALCDLLLASGYRPGVISRGYGSALIAETLVSSESVAAEVGDEPLLIARRTACPVAVGKNRVAAATLLLQHHDCDLLLSDDGLQHYALQRDMEVAVVDAERMHGNGYYLPAGPLREPVERLHSVDLVAYNGAGDSLHNFSLEQMAAENIKTGARAELTEFATKPVHAVAGIGHPQRFFEQLSVAGLTVSEHAFADHHVYVDADLNFSDTNDILMTEKDAVKCDRIKLNTIWSVPVVARLSPRLEKDFLDRVHSIVGCRRGVDA